MGFFTPNKQNNTPAARRKHLTNMRFIIVFAGGYILYDGIRSVVANPSGTPVWFYIYLVVFALAMIGGFLLNEWRIRTLDQQIAEDAAKEASEAKQLKDGQDEDDEPNDLDDPQ